MWYLNLLLWKKIELLEKLQFPFFYILIPCQINMLFFRLSYSILKNICLLKCVWMNVCSFLFLDKVVTVFPPTVTLSALSAGHHILHPGLEKWAPALPTRRTPSANRLPPGARDAGGTLSWTSLSTKPSTQQEERLPMISKIYGHGEDLLWFRLSVSSNHPC